MKNSIIQENWLPYLKWWKVNVNDKNDPPTENNFWAWYCIEVLGHVTDN